MNSILSESNHNPYQARGISGQDPAGTSSGPREPGLSPDVFHYEDYRRFLWDRFVEMQCLDPGFSQRKLARKAGIANPGFFNEVIKGRRRLSLAAAAKMSMGLALDREASEYFSALVEFTETREARAKIAAGKKMILLRNRKFMQGLGDTPASPENLQAALREFQDLREDSGQP